MIQLKKKFGGVIGTLSVFALKTDKVYMVIKDKFITCT